MAQTKISKAVSKNVLWAGLIILAIGSYLTFKKSPTPGGQVVMFIGFILAIFWVANRNDQICTFDENDNETCVDIKK